MKSRRGTVWCDGTRVGGLREDDRGRLAFAYEPDWLRRGFPLSLSLPLRSGTDEVDAHEFFVGLLPEGASRHRICRQYRLDERDDVGLLFAIGGDCAGALTILLGDAAPDASEDNRAMITKDDLGRLVRSQGRAVPVIGQRQRFSLAGAQDKLAVRIDGDEMWLPHGGYPSSHILKFETIPWVCFAEFAASELARHIGLKTVEMAYYRHDDKRRDAYLKIQRYDRRHHEGRLRRLHQEDMAQALGYPSERKYQDDGGPSVADIASLIRRHTADPITDIPRLRDWQIFNYLVGNSDGHAKNLGLLYEYGSSLPRLAPFYDLVCIEFMNRIGVTSYKRSMALAIGRLVEPERITRDDWTALARGMGVPPKRLLQRLKELAEGLPDVAARVRAEFAGRFGDNQVYDRFEESIRDRCRWTLNSVFVHR